MINVGRLSVGRDTRVVLDSVREGYGGPFSNARSFQIAIYERAINATTGRSEKGTAVVSSIPMQYQPLTNGRYVGQIPGGTSLTDGTWYIVEITETNAAFKQQALVRAEVAG